MEILEGQPGALHASLYTYVGPRDGLHAFKNEDGSLELFARRKSVAGWQLARGAWRYEFCRSVQP
jgi:hypothetical protein